MFVNNSMGASVRAERARRFAGIIASSCAILASFLFSGLASATPIGPLEADFDQDYKLQEIIDSGGIIIGDKLFDMFDVTPSKHINGRQITITPVLSNGDYGFHVNGGWVAGAGHSVDSTIAFRATILPEYVQLGYAFKDVSLWITAKMITNTDHGIVSVSEDVYAQDPSEGKAPIANAGVYYASDVDQQLHDSVVFTPITQIWIRKDVVVDNSEGTRGVVHLSEFYQTFSQVGGVPEPSTLVLLGMAAFGLLGYLWRKRRAG